MFRNLPFSRPPVRKTCESKPNGLFHSFLWKVYWKHRKMNSDGQLQSFQINVCGNWIRLRTKMKSGICQKVACLTSKSPQSATFDLNFWKILFLHRKMKYHGQLGCFWIKSPRNLKRLWIKLYMGICPKVARLNFRTALNAKMRIN